MSADEAVAAMRRLDQLIDELAVLRFHFQVEPERAEFTAVARPVEPRYTSEPQRLRR
jgi:hypothetical protein